MKQSHKVDKWDGIKKAIVRAQKTQEIKWAKEEDDLPAQPVALTLAGAKAHLEISITKQGLVQPKDITTVQSPLLPSTTVGTDVLRKLIKLRDASLPGMLIWPESFSSFCKGYKPGRASIPSFSVSKKTPPAWYRSPTFRREMHKFIEVSPRPFDIIDADLCGIFSKDNATSITNLMHNNMLSDSGLLFINHLKGRDSQCVPFLRDYFHVEGLFDLHTLQDYYGEALSLTLDEKDTWDKQALFYAIRRTLVPMYYIIEAYKAGYQLEPIRLMEYRDRNKKTTNIGTNMLQWFFRFKKLASKRAAETGTFEAYFSTASRAKKKEKEILKYQLKILVDESYVYNNYVD